MATRTETDAMGSIEVPVDKYWGAQTQRYALQNGTLALLTSLRSLQNFDINQPTDRMPPTLIRAFGFLKGAAAKVNAANGVLGMRTLSVWKVNHAYSVLRSGAIRCDPTGGCGSLVVEAD